MSKRILCVSLLVLATLLGGCGRGASSDSQTPRELTLERTQFEQVSGDLSATDAGVKREVATSRTAWPLISSGLPQTVSRSLAQAVGKANASAKALGEPSFAAYATKLTGPAAGLVGIYEDYEQLTRRGWALTTAAIAAISSHPPAVASFARENSPLYIDAIYDGHYDLSLLGKSLASGYEKLGGPAAFGRALTQSEVDALSATYSIPGVRLEPHPAGAAKEG